MIIDVLLLLLLAGGFVLGFFRGIVRQLLALGAWLVVFLAAAHLRLPVGDWLARNSTEFSFDYAQMLAFTAIFLALVAAALLLVELGGSGSALTRHPLLDDSLGGLGGLLLAVLIAAGITVALDSYYAVNVAPAPGEVGWLRDVHEGLTESVLAAPLREWVIRPLGAWLAPILPSDIRVVMG